MKTINKKTKLVKDTPNKVKDNFIGMNKGIDNTTKTVWTKGER